ncbi:MAG: Ig-like domain-containing protein, partial [Treponemataceae bacterium]
PVDRVEVSQSTLSILLDEKSTLLKEVVYPRDATTKGVSWKSEHPNIVKVDAKTGAVEGLSLGSSRVSVITDDGAKTASCVVTVENPPVTDITFNPSSVSFSSGGRQKVIATVMPSNSSTIPTWTSSNTSVAELEGSGKEVTVKGWSGGSTTVSVKGDNTTKSFNVTVSGLGYSYTATQVNVTGVGSLTGDVEIGIPSSVHGVEVTAIDTNAFQNNAVLETIRIPSSITSIGSNAFNNASKLKTVYIDSDTVGNLPSNESMLFSKLEVVHVKEDILINSASYIGKYFKDKGSVSNGYIPYKKTGIPVSSITLNKSKTRLVVGGDETLRATVYPDDANNKSICWSSSDSSIASVDPVTGKVFAHSYGTAIIKAAADSGVSEPCTVNVFDWASSGTGKIQELTDKSDNNSKVLRITIDSQGWSNYHTDINPTNPKPVKDVEELHFVIPGGDTNRNLQILSSCDTDKNVYITMQDKAEVWEGDNGSGLRIRGSGKGKITIHLRLLGSKNDKHYENRIWSGKKNSKWESIYQSNDGSAEIVLYGSGSSSTNYFTLRAGGQTSTVIDGSNILMRGSYSSTVTSPSHSISFPLKGTYNGKKKCDILKLEINSRVRLNGIKIKEDISSLQIDESKQLQAVFYPSAAANRKVEWSSSNNNIVRITKSGMITGVSPGSATIMVRSDDGGWFDEITITVKAKIDPENLIMDVGETRDLEIFLPANSVSLWKESDKNLITLDVTGKKARVNAWSAGNARVTVEGDGFKTIANVRVTGLSYSRSATQLTVTGYGASTDKAEIIIPSSVHGIPVNKIDREALDHNLKIVILRLPSSIESIGEKAFFNTINLQSVYVDSESIANLRDNSSNLFDSANFIYVKEGITVNSNSYIEKNYYKGSVFNGYVQYANVVTQIMPNPASISIRAGGSVEVSTTVFPSQIPTALEWSGNYSDAASIEGNNRNAIIKGWTANNGAVGKGKFVVESGSVKSNIEVSVSGLKYLQNDNEISVDGIGTLTNYDITIPSNLHGIPVTSISGFYGTVDRVEVISIPSTIKAVGASVFGSARSLRKAYIDSEIVANFPTNETSLFTNLETVYIKDGITLNENSFVSKYFSKKGSSDNGYTPYNRSTISSSSHLNKTFLKLFVGEEYTLKATLLPEDATDKTITWSGSDSYVRVNPVTGTVFAAAQTYNNNSSIITATTEAGVVVGTCEVKTFNWSSIPSSGRIQQLTDKEDNNSKVLRITINSAGESHYHTRLDPLDPTELKDVNDMHFNIPSGATDRNLQIVNYCDMDKNVYITMQEKAEVWEADNGSGLRIYGTGKGKITIHIRVLGVSKKENRIWSGKGVSSWAAIDKSGFFPAEIVFRGEKDNVLSLRSGGETKYLIGGNVSLRSAYGYRMYSPTHSISFPHQGSFQGDKNRDIMTVGFRSLILPSSLKIDFGDPLLLVGETRRLYPILSPSNTDCTNVIWHSSDESIAKIDAKTGELQAISAGKAIITVYSDYSPLSFSAPITIREKDMLDFELVGRTYHVTGIGSYESSNLVIPDTHQGLPVTEIAANAFDKTRNTHDIVRVSFGKNITRIGTFAFYKQRMENLTIPSYITYIGVQSFQGETIKNLTFERSSTPLKIDHMAFFEQRMENLTIPSRVVEIGNAAFSKGVIKNLIFESSSTPLKIGNSAFYQQRMENLTIPAHVSSIGRFAFAKGVIKNLTFENGSLPLIIGEQAFQEQGMQTLNIVSRITEIGKQAFADGVIKNLTFESSSTPLKIGESAFYAQKIESLTIPSRISVISRSAFSTYKGRGTIKNLTFEEGKTPLVIGDNAFQYHKIEELTIPMRVTSIGRYSFITENPVIKKLSFEKGSLLTFIDDFSFYNAGIDKLVIPPYLNLTGVHAFGFTSNLKFVYCDSQEFVSRANDPSFLLSNLRGVFVKETLEVPEHSYIRNNFTDVSSASGGYVLYRAVEAASITLNKNETRLVVGGYEPLVATILPKDAKDKSIVWKSDNTYVASVDPVEGKVFAYSTGSTVIRAISSNGLVATCTVTVFDWNSSTGSIQKVTDREDNNSSVLRITIDPRGRSHYHMDNDPRPNEDVEKLHFSIPAGNTDRNLQVVSYSDVNKNVYITMQDKAKVWESDNGSGLRVKGYGKGKITIHLRLLGSKNDKKYENRIWSGKGVSQWPAIKLDTDAFTPADIVFYSPTDRSSYLTLRSGGKTNLLVSEDIGLRSAYGFVGANLNGPIYGKKNCDIKKLEIQPVKRLERIAIYGKVTSMDIGKSQKIDIILNPSNASNNRVIWSTSDTHVVSVRYNEIQARGPGQATIMARSTDGGLSDSFVVTVQP